MKTLRHYRTSLGGFMTALVAVWQICSPLNLNAATGTWILDAAGNWTGTPANWAGGIIPNGIDDIAFFNNNITASRIVTLNAPITLGGLTIGDALGVQAFTFAGSAVNTLTFDVTAGNASLNKYNSVTDIWQAPLILNDNLNANIYSGILDVTNGVAQVSYTGTGDTIKNGAGTLRLNIDAVSGAGYTGDWVMNLGTLNIGGANGAAPTSLGTGTGGITLNGTGTAGLTIFSLNNNGTAVSNTDIVYAGNNDVILQGAATINVDRNYIAAGANTGNTVVLDNLTANGGILSVTGANSYRLRFAGTTTLVGDTNVFSVGANATSNFANLTLSGVITDGVNSRALIKEGAGRMIVSNAANTYDGVTVIKDGVLQVATGANIGTGAVYVNGGALALTSAAQPSVATGGLNLISQIGTSRASLAAIVNTGFIIDGANPLAVNVPIYGMALEVDNIANNIDVSQVGGAGNTRVYLSNRLGFDSTYTGVITAATNATIRLASATNNLILSTANQLGGAASTDNLIVGIDQANPLLFAGIGITHGTGGTVSVRANNAATLGTVTVNRGVTLNINGAITTPIGAGVVTALGGTISTDATSAAQFGNTDFRLYGGSTLLLDNSAVAVLNTDRRLLVGTNIDLTSSTLRLLGDGGAATVSSQTVNSIDYLGGSTLSVDTDGTTALRLTTLTTGTLNRTSRGTLNIRNTNGSTTTFGTAAGTQKLIITTNPTVTNGMIGADIALWGGTTSNDATQPLFATYDATHGVQAAAFTLSGAAVDTAAELNGAATSAIVSIDALTANMAVTTASVQALRIRTTNNTTQSVNTGTITIGSIAAAGQGAGLYLAHTANNTVTHSANFAFGTQEGLIYAVTSGGTAGVVALSGILSGSNGVTRFGNGILRLSGTNTFTGPLTINSGETRLNNAQAGGVFTNPANMIDLWGGSLYFEAATQRYNNNITFNDDARLGNVNVANTGFNNLTVAARTGSTAPIVLDIRNQAGTNVTTAYGGLTLNGPAQAYVTHLFQINGALSGTGTLEKFGNERLFIGGDSSAYAQAVTVNTGFLNSINSISTAKPFGTGAITINPGGTLRIAAPTNINAGQVTMNSDLGGISGIGMSYVGDPGALPALTVNSTAPWKAFLGVGSVAFNYNLDQSATGLWGGNVYLGALLGETGIYTGTLTPNASNQFLLGTGQGTIRIASSLTGAGNSAIIGLSMTGDVGRADQMVNNSGGVAQYDVAMTYGGSTIIHTGSGLRIAARAATTALGDITLNGGLIQPDSANGQARMVAPLAITNNLILAADSTIQMQNVASDVRLTGNIILGAGQTGVVRQLNVGVDGVNAGNVILEGNIIDGAGGSGNHFIKTGYGTLFLRGANTYTGTTNVIGGLLGVNSDADFGTTSQIILNGGGLGIFENSFTSAKNLSFHGGNGWFDVNAGLTFTQSAASTYDGNSTLMKRGLGTMVLNGTNAQVGIYIGEGVLQVNSQASLGDPATTSAVLFGGDQSPGSGTAFRTTGGTLRINSTMTTNRGMNFVNNGSTNYAGGIDVTAGNTFTVTGAIIQGTEFDFGFKTGAGAMVVTGANTWRQVAVTNGTYQFATSTPWTNSTATAADNTNIEMLGGTIRAVNTAANIALANAASTTNYNYGGGMHLRLESGAGFSVEFAGDNLVRVNQGTLVIETAGGTTLGGVAGSDAGRLLTTNAINSGLARASALNNGIFAAHLITADTTGVANFTTNDAATGIKAFTFAPANDVNVAVATTIDSFSTAQVLTANRSIYAFSTTANVSGGTLRIGAIDNVREGGILINGSNTISSNLIFDPTSLSAPGTGTVGEGLIYVKEGENASLTGNVTANALTKFGRGTLTLGSGTSVLGDLSIQEGTLKLSGTGLTSRMNSELNINAGATLDLNGSSIAAETIGANNRQVAGIDVGGQITNSSGTASVLGVSSPVNSTFTGTINGNLALTKSGAGVLAIDGYRASTPDAGNNTFIGGTNIYGVNTTGGINLQNSTFGLGGFGGASVGDVNLYSGTLGLLYSGNWIGVGAGSAPMYNNLVLKIGAEAGNGVTVNVKGPGQINVNQVAGAAIGLGNIMQIGDLNMSNNTLNLSGGNAYLVRVAGTTTIQGAQATFATNSDGPGGAIDFAGVIQGAGALNKTVDGTMRGIIISGNANTYSGGTNIIGGDVDVRATSAALIGVAEALGTGAIRVFPDGTLRIAGNGSIDGTKLQVMSRVNALGAVALSASFNPTVLTAANFGSIYNTTLQLADTYWTQALNMATIGDGRAFLGSGLNGEIKYMAATLGAGVADTWNPGVGVYRLVGGVNNLAFEGANNVFTGTAYMQVGPQRNNVLGAATNTGNAVIIRNSNNYSGGTQIAEGTVLISEMGGSPIGETALGTGAVEVYGEYRIQGQLGSAWKADALAATNTINLRAGGLVRIFGATGEFTAGDQGKWGDAVGIDLNGGTFNYTGAANWNSVETIGTVDVRKGGTLSVFRSTTASSAQLNVAGLNRIAGGTLAITHNVNFLGTNLTTPLSYERLTVAGGVVLGGTTTDGAGVINPGIAPVWIVDATTNSFVGYDPTGAGTGFQPLISTLTPGAGEISYNKIVSGALTGVGAGDIVDVTSTGTLAANTTLYAMRVGAFNISPTAGFNTITITSGGLIMTGGTINPTSAITAGVVSPMTLNFGVAGAGEAIIYNSGTAIIQAQMNAALGLTKFGAGQLQIHSINSGIGGPVTINAGTLYVRVPFSGSGAAVGQALNSQDVILNGGALVLDPFLANAAGTASEIASNIRATALFNSNIFVRADSTLGNNGQANYVRIQNLTFENAGGATAMNGNGVISLALQSGLWVDGTTTLNEQAVFNSSFNGFAQSTFAGQVTGAADLEKFGNGTMTLLNGTNNYSGGTLIQGTTNATATSVVASGFRGVGTPFGTGDITVNPGGLLRIADNLNIASNVVNLRSDGVGLAGLGIAHNGALPTITTGVALAGQVHVESTGPFAGVITLDYGYYDKALNMATIPGGNWFLGNSTQAETFYFNQTLGAAANGKYLIGGGGNQSGITFGSVLVSAGRTSLFENVFSGGSAGNVRVEVGALTADLSANGPSFVNGNSGFMAMISRNTSLVGDVRVNTNSVLAIGNNFALGSGRLILNGGGLRYDFGPNNAVSSSITINNNVLLQGDFFTTSGNDFVIKGNVAMHDGAAGATRIWNLTGTGTMGVYGVISGNDGSNLIKSGAQNVVFSGANTYQGYTQINQGTIIAVGDVMSGVAGPLGNSTSPITLASGAANVAGGIGIGGKYTIGRDIMVSQNTGTGSALIENRTNETARVTGGISIITGGILTVGSAAASVTTFTGGTLDIQGPISGAGALVVGTTAVAPGNGGTVLLSASSNGYGTNTYSGGTTLQSGRLQIASDTYFSGPVTAPTILSGPLGTGTFTFGAGETNRGGTIEAVGGARTIVNALGADGTLANTTRSFSGHEALTFTRDYNINSDATLRNRVFTTNNLYQAVTFSGNLSNTGAQGSNFLKNGAGMLILTGTNTQANLLITDGNYGTGVFIDGGILRVGADASLGSTAALAAAGPHLLGPADVRLRGGVLSISSGFATARQFILTAASGIDVAAGQTLTLSTQTAGAFGITKTGNGTLALNNSANTITALTLGGVQQLNPNSGRYSHTGGTVSTTAVAGTPFATASVTINSGTLSLVGGGVAQALVIPTVTYGAAAHIALNAGATSSQLTATAFARGNTFNTLNYGTLTINPSALANLAVTEKLLVTAGAPANTAGTGGDILTVPSVFAALAGSGQDANFTRYDAVNGFAQHSVTTVASLAVAPGTVNLNVADIVAPDTVGLVAGDIIDILAVRTNSNIAGVDSTALLRINGGGLIINGGTASTLSANVLFGTGTGAGLTEAIVYVRDGQIGTSAISGNITARDFTKTGPGTLEISGTTNLLNSNATRLPVLSVQDGTLRFASAAAQFQNELRGTTLGNFIGHYVLNVNEAGIFDMNGLNTTIGGLTGNGTVTSNIAGATTLTVKNGFGVDTTFSGSITNGAGTVGLTKTQNGALILTGHNTYSGGTTVQAGRVTNSVGSTAASGRLEAQTMTALGTGPVTLAGGMLTLNATTLLSNAQTTSEVTDGIDYNLWGGPNGLDITIGSSGFTNGVALPANVTSTLNAGTQQAGINSLTINAPILTTTAGLIQVNGATTINQDTVLRTAGGRLFLAGQLNAAGRTLTKTGANDLVLSNTEAGAGQNSVGLWKVYGGILDARSADGASNPLGSGVTVEINGGSTNYGLFLHTDGNGTGLSELVTTYADTNIRFGSMLGVSSNEFVSSSNGRLQVDRVLANNGFKTVVVNNLEVGGVLGSPYVYMPGGNNDSIWVNGTTTFTRDMYLQNDVGLTLNGIISGNGTFNKRTGGNLFINADNTTGWAGGTILGIGGTTYLGSLEGNQITLSNTAKLGPGHVIINPLAAFQINDAGNLQTGQHIYVAGNINSFGTFRLAANLSLDTVKLGAFGLGGIQPTTTNYYTTAVNPASGVLALNTIYTQTLDMLALGDGMWYLGSTTNGLGANGSYDAATLGAGLGNTYRLGAGGATLFFGSNGNTNILSNNSVTGASNSLIVGAPMSVENSASLGGGSGTVVLLGSQNYTGSTFINRGSTLDFRGTLATSSIETYGGLNVAGEAGTFIGAGVVTLRPGSILRFDNTSAGVLPVADVAGRWADATGIALDNSTLRMQGNAAVETSETVGAITTTGGSFIEVVRGVIGRGTEIRTSGISRVGFGTIQMNHNGSQLGTDERLIVTGVAPTVTNGMVGPWMVSNTDIQFLTYNANTGFTDAGFDRAQAAATLAATVTATTNRTLFTGAVVLNAGVDFETYALRLDGNVTLTAPLDNTAQLIIGSGGLISNGTRTITSGIVAGSIATPTELLIYNNGTTTIGDATAANRDFQGQILASSITKFGGGQLQLRSEQQTFTGDIHVQQGSLVLYYANGIEANPISKAGGNGGTIFLDGPNVTLFLRGGQDSLTGNVTFSNSVTLGDYNPIVQIDVDRFGGTITGRSNILSGNFTFGANNAETGQIVRFRGVNDMILQIGDSAADSLTLVGKSVFDTDNNFNANDARLLVEAKTTGTGTLVKGPIDTRADYLELRNVTSLNDWSGGTIVMGGTLRVFAQTANGAVNSTQNITSGGLGTGDVTLMGGMLDLRVDNQTAGVADTNLERTRYGSAGNGPNLIVNGSSQINVDRTGLIGTGTTKQIGLGNLTIGSQVLTVTGGNAYGLEITGTTTMQGNMFLNNGVDFVLNGAIGDGGAGMFINKIGIGTLWVNTNNNTATSPNGGAYINAGLLDFGDRLTGSTTATLGIGDIYVNAGASARIRGAGNLNTAQGQQFVLTSTAYSSALLRTVGAFTQAQLASFIQPRTTTSNEVTYISFEAAPGANNLDQSTLGDGRIYFGAIGDRTYTGAAVGSSLTPGLANFADSVVGGTSANRVYRLGHNSGNTLTINLTAAGAGLADVGGVTDVQIGSLATLGTSNFNTGYVYFQDQNTYTGQTVVSRGLTLRFNTATNVGDTAGPLGVGAGGAALIDIYGTLRSESGSSLRNNAGTGQFYTNINLHPGSLLTFYDMAAAGNRWDDATAINLDGSTLQGEAVINVDNGAETVGAITFDRGSRIYATSEGTGDAFLTAASITRAAAGPGAGTGRGTLVFGPSNTTTFGVAAAAGTAQQQVIFTAAPTASATSGVAGMLPGYYIDGTGHRFVKNGANGITPVVDGDMVAMPTGAGTGTEVVNLTVATTMGAFETSIFALRGGNFSLNSPTGANNDATITFGGSGADIGAVISTTATFTINPNLKFGATGTNEALFYAGSTLQINGNITAGSITKFGAGQMNVGNDQSDAARGTGQGYSNGWVINEGQLNLQTFGSAGNAVASNTIVLNGNQQTTPTLFLRAQPGDTLLNYTYTSGRIIAVDNATIDFDPGADDRIHTIADIEIQQSGGIGNAPANGTVDAQLRIVNNRSRTILAAGQLTLTNNAILNVDATVANVNYTSYATNAAYLTNGTSSGMSVASLNGSARLTKWGDGVLYVRGASAGFTGSVVIDEGAIFVTNNQSLGSGAVTINRYGVLEIGVANYVQTNSSITYNEGSVERWSVDGARTGAINLGKATLQVGADQTGTVAVTLNGGSIESWVRSDDLGSLQQSNGVFRNLGANVSITLAGNSFVGNQYYLGANGLDNGKLANDNRPVEEYVGSGSILNVQGVISGVASLTKVGYDTVFLSGANTYSGGTTVSGGKLMLGRNDALLSTGNLTTYANGVLDLNGYNQTVGKLSNPADVATNVSATNNGYITNSSTTVKTLTVGNGVSTDFTYRGVIQHNVALTKIGTSMLTLTNANTYTGTTTVNVGTLKLDFSAGGAPASNIINNLSNLSALSMGGGTLTLTGKASTINSQSFNGFNLTGGTNYIQVMANVTANPLLLSLNMINRTGGTIDFVLPTGIQDATNGITTDLLNTNGILGGWATIGGTDFAMNGPNTLDGNIIAYTAYTDVTRLSSGSKVIADGSTSNVRIIEGTGGAANITLGAATTTINTLNQSTSGGTSAAIIDLATQTLAVNSVLVATGAGDLTIGTAVNNGTLSTATSGGELILQNYSTSTMTVNSVIANNTSASRLTVGGGGTGVTILTGTNTYTGATTVNAGNLQVGSSSTGSTAAGSAVSVNGATAILSGTGTVFGTTTVTLGQIRPGDSGGIGEGTLNLAGGLTFNHAAAATAASFTIQGTTIADETGDLINITGALTLDSDSNFVVTNGGTLTPTIGQSWTLINWTTLLTLNGWSAGTNLRTGNNLDLNEGNLDLVDITASGLSWDISNFTVNGSIAIVPEPSRALLLFLGLMALFFRRRRSRDAY